MKRACGVYLALTTTLLLVGSSIGTAQTNTSLTGTWLAKEGPVTVALTLNADGRGTLDGTNIKFTIRDSVLTVDEAGVINRYTFQLSGNKLTLTGGDLDKPMVFEREGAGSSSGLGGRRARAAVAGGPASSPVGAWETQGPNGAIRLELKADKTGTFGGGKVGWQFNQGILSLTGPNGATVMYSAALTESSLTVSGGNLAQPVVFERLETGSGSAGPKRGGEPANSDRLVGRWQGPAGIVEIKAGGAMLIQGVNYRYTVQGDTLNLIGNDGSLTVPFRLDDDALTLTFSGQAVTLKRLAADTANQGTGGGIASELVGKWCYFSSFSANSGGGSMTDECFTLFSNGTYQYHREGSISAYAPGIYGGTASQSDDAGTWRLAGSTVTVVSRSQGTSTYVLEKRNHPKTGDPMVCLDGRCFVTYNQRPPWR